MIIWVPTLKSCRKWKTFADDIKARAAVESLTGLLKGVGTANKAKNIDSGRTKDERRCTHT